MTCLIRRLWHLLRGHNFAHVYELHPSAGPYGAVRFKLVCRCGKERRP